MDDELPFLKTIEEAAALKQTLVEDLQRIQLELSNKDVRSQSGRRKDGITYHKWRQTRLEEMTLIQRKLQHVKNWIRVHSSLPGNGRPVSPRSRVQALELVFRRLKAYIEYNDSKGNTDWNPDLADERWTHILSAIDEVDKAKDETLKEEGKQEC